MISRFLPVLSVFPLALAAAACSDPPPTPAAMGISLNLVPPVASELNGASIGSRTCNAEGTGSWTYEIGQPAPRKTLEDGKNGVSVECTVRSDGTFSAQASGYDKNTKEKLSLNVGGHITDKNNPMNAGTGSLTFYTPLTQRLETSNMYPACTFGPVSTLKKGAILTDITCPMLILTDDSSTGCKAHGTIAFEYCKTGEEED